MIKVLHYGLSTNMGGIETYLLKLWNNIDKKKFQFDFIDTNIDKPCFYDEFTELGSNFYKITPRSKSVKKNRHDLEQLFSTQDFDILHCHLNTLSYIEPIKVALKHNCKVIVHSRSAGASKTIRTLMLHFLNSLLLPKEKVEKVAVSKLAGEWLFGKNSNFVTINNGIDISKYEFSSSIRNEQRKLLNIEDKFVVGHIGAFLPVKNHKFIIEVFKEIQKRNSNSYLLLVGVGPQLNEIKNLVKSLGLEKKVFFAGRRVDISELLAAMDSFIFPSLFEGFPNAVVEAQTSGLPSFISDKITNEVVVTEICNKLPLESSSDFWAEEILNFNVVDNRGKYTDIMKYEGFAVKEEIKKIEQLYLKLQV